MTSRIACAGISGRIIQGRVSADGKSFVGQTKDVTSDVLAAVIDKLKHHGGSFTINCNGEPVATLTLSEPGSQQAGAVSVPRELLGLAADFLVAHSSGPSIEQNIAADFRALLNGGGV